MSWIKLKTVSIAKLPMPMKALTSDTWCVNGRTLDAAVECLRKLLHWWWLKDSRYRRIIEPGSVQEGFHLMRPSRGSLGLFLVPEDWLVRVFVLSGLLDRPYDRLSVWIIPLCVWMDILSRYTRHYLGLLMV